MGTRPYAVPALIVAVLLLIAVADLPYGYFTFLRWSTCGVAIFIAVKSYQWGHRWATWLFGVIAILFNPFIPIHLTKGLWQPINTVCALLFVSSVLALHK